MSFQLCCDPAQRVVPIEPRKPAFLCTRKRRQSCLQFCPHFDKHGAEQTFKSPSEDQRQTAYFRYIWKGLARLQLGNTPLIDA